jgi:hypothetical protein
MKKAEIKINSFVRVKGVSTAFVTDKQTYGRNIFQVVDVNCYFVCLRVRPGTGNYMGPDGSKDMSTYFIVTDDVELLSNIEVNDRALDILCL